MAVVEEQIEEGLALILGDVVAVPLGKDEHALVEDDGQWGEAASVIVIVLSRGRRIAEEVENQGVNALPCWMEGINISVGPVRLMEQRIDVRKA
jgi:hypothetical protein